MDIFTHSSVSSAVLRAFPLCMPYNPNAETWKGITTSNIRMGLIRFPDTWTPNYNLMASKRTSLVLMHETIIFYFNYRFDFMLIGLLIEDGWKNNSSEPSRVRVVIAGATNSKSNKCQQRDIGNVCGSVLYAAQFTLMGLPFAYRHWIITSSTKVYIKVSLDSIPRILIWNFKLLPLCSNMDEDV